VTIVLDLVSMQIGEYITKTPGRFGTINIHINPIGKTAGDFVGTIFGRTKNKIIQNVPEKEGEGFITIPAAETEYDIDTMCIIRAGDKEPVFKLFAVKEMSELVEKMKGMEESREIEKSAFETYRRERMRMKADDLVEVMKSLAPEERKRLKDRFSEMGMEDRE